MIFAWIYGIFIFTQNTLHLLYTVTLLNKFKKTLKTFDEEVKKPLESYPPISIVTSIRGTSMPLEEGLTCLMQQDYPGELELIVAIEDSGDPAYGIAKEVLSKIPHRMEVKWITDFKAEGGNPRMAKLAYGAKFAKHKWIYILATDTFSDASHLRKMMHKTKLDKKVYVSSIPIQFGTSTLGAILETIPMVWEIPMYGLMCDKVKRPFIYGGSILFHMDLMQEAGGFGPILNYLTEEVPMSDAFTRVGGRFELVPSLMWVRQEKQTVAGFYERKLRWAMIGRFHHPQLFFLGFVFSPLWLIVFWLLSGNPIFLSMLGVFLTVKSLVVYLYHILLGLPRAQAKWSLIMFPYEFISFTFCVHALFRKRLNWAGDIMLVNSHGVVTREV